MFVPVQCFLLVLSMFFMYKLEITSYLQDPFIPFQFLLLMIGLLILNMVGVIDDLIRILHFFRYPDSGLMICMDYSE